MKDNGSYRILITGAAVRVGRQIAIHAATMGAEVVIGYNSSERQALELVRSLRDQGYRATALKCDLGDSDRVSDLIERASELCGGGLNCLVNCVSAFSKDKKGELYGSLEEHLRPGLIAPYLLSHKLYEQCQQRSLPFGRIVNITDTALEHPAKDFTAYYAAKGGLDALTRALAVSFGPLVTVNAVAPGAVLAKEGRDEAYFARRAGELPVGRTGTAGEVASAVWFLLTNGFVTGETIRVDGGEHLL